MRARIPSKERQLGQTLIETLVGIFILITGLISALTLAIYSFNSTDTSSKQIVATSLAAEGIEAVKNIRDSNWLNDTLADCSSDLGGIQRCYRNWLGSGPQKLNAGDYTIDFTSSSGSGSWVINPTPPDYTLNFDAATGQYHNGGSGVLSAYSRKVHIDWTQTAPYTGLDPRLTVTSTVWWSGRTCPATSNPDLLPNSCKVILKSYLTNWKNF